MSWSHVQHNYVQDVTGTNSLTWSITISAVSANSAVSGEFMFDDTGGASLVSIKSDKGDTATITDSNSDPGNEGAVGYAFAGLTAGATVLTATLSIATGFIAFSADEDNPGAGLNPVLDGHNTRLQTGLGAATDNITTNSFTTSANGDLVKAFTMMTDGRVATWAAGTGFTARNNVPGTSGTIGGLSEDLVQTTAGSITPTITVSTIVGGFPINVLSFGMAFKTVAAGGDTFANNGTVFFI